MLGLLKIEAPFTIAIDRTEWQLGTQWVNVLMLSIAYRSISIPLFWTVIDEKGCSDDAERRAILQKFIDEFGRGNIRFVTREARVLFKGMAQVSDRKRDFLSLADQGELSDHERAGRRGAGVATVPNLEDQRAPGVARKAFIVGSGSVCGSVPQTRRRPCAGHFIGAKRSNIARIRGKMEDRNIVRNLENTRVSA